MSSKVPVPTPRPESKFFLLIFMFVFNFYFSADVHLILDAGRVNDHYIKFYFNGSRIAFCVFNTSLILLFINRLCIIKEHILFVIMCFVKNLRNKYCRVQLSK